MAYEEYWQQTVVAGLAFISALLAVMEIYIPEGSKVRLWAELVYGYFKRDVVKSFPARLVKKYSDKLFSLNKMAADAREYTFIVTVDALMLVPITICRFLSRPMPSRLFNSSPLLYYALVMTTLLIFLRSLAAAMRGHVSRLFIWSSVVFLFFCQDIFRMSLFFVSMDKSGIISEPDINSFVFLGLNHLISRPAALAVVTLLIGFSGSLLLFVFLSWVLFWLPEHVRSGIANITARAMFCVGCIQSILLIIAPEARIDSELFFATYELDLIVIAVCSGLFFFCIGKAEERLLSTTLGLIAIPALVFLIYVRLLPAVGGERQFYYSAMLTLLLISSPFLLAYLPALFSFLVSTSVRISTLVFRPKEVTSKPFATASIFLALLAALGALAYIQTAFFLSE